MRKNEEKGLTLCNNRCPSFWRIGISSCLLSISNIFRAKESRSLQKRTMSSSTFIAFRANKKGIEICWIKLIEKCLDLEVTSYKKEQLVRVKRKKERKGKGKGKRRKGKRKRKKKKGTKRNFWNPSPEGKGAHKRVQLVPLACWEGFHDHSKRRDKKIGK